MKRCLLSRHPTTCPADPIDKQRHLHALALVALINGESPASNTGRPEYVVVIDTSQPDGNGGPVVDWGIPVEIPTRILAELVGDADPSQIVPIVVRNGVILHAPGTLDLGRSNRLANRAQRRALRGLYSTCAIPGCTVHFDRCKLHHIIEWEHGGLTDLANLLPICPHHHAMVHATAGRSNSAPTENSPSHSPTEPSSPPDPPTGKRHEMLIAVDHVGSRQ